MIKVNIKEIPRDSFFKVDESSNILSSENVDIKINWVDSSNILM